MKILVVGGGAARARALLEDPPKPASSRELYCAPGNGGIAEIARCVDLAVDDVEPALSIRGRDRRST